MEKKKKSFGFIADPLDHFDPERETTLLLMAEAERRGHRIFALTLPDLFSTDSEPQAEAQEIKILKIGRRPFYQSLSRTRISLTDLNVLFLRKDPPLDMAYVHHLYLLEPLKGKVLMVNEPMAILRASEKIYPLRFPQWIPATCLSSRWDEMERFARGQKKGIVIKPLNSSGGRGVFYFRPGDSNFKVAFEILSENGAQFVVGQEFLPEVVRGDKRVLLLNGDILGYFNRLPSKGNHRANLHSGGRLARCSLSPKEKMIALEIGQVMKKEGLYFVGLDLIGERVTEINVTSPMGLNEINRTQGGKSEGKVIDWVGSQL